jgi:hypothetical protein
MWSNSSRDPGPAASGLEKVFPGPHGSHRAPPTFFRRRRISLQTRDRPVEAWIDCTGEAFAADKSRIVEGDWFARGA